MKPLKNIWPVFTDKKNIRQAIINAAKGKNYKRAVQKVIDNLDYYTDSLYKMLTEETFTPSPYKTQRIKTEYGKERDISVIKFFPDQCIEHLISIVLHPYWVKALTSDTYACLKERGINSGNLRYNMNHKVKRAINSFKGKPLYCLKMDIKKCYQTTDNEILALIYRKYIRDPKMLRLLDMLNFASDGLLIGRYLSQLWINLILNELDRFCKEGEGMKVRYYFRYLDDIVLFSDNKEQLHEWQWRIMEFCRNTLHYEMNQKRQIFPVGKARGERGVDFGGYVFFRGFTLLRKRIKKSFAKRRHNPKSVTSYEGLAMHCESHNLIKKILNKNNSMELSNIITNKLNRPFEGNKVKIEKVVDKEIEILDFEIIPSTKKPNTNYLKLQIRFEGQKHFIGGGYSFLCETLSQIDKSQLPVTTIIRNNRGYYFEGTIDTE